jgi:hypothetical protein
VFFGAWSQSDLARFLNPDCGFGTFSRRPVNSQLGAPRKLAAIVESTRAVRERLQLPA